MKIWATLLALCGALLCGEARAADFPTRPVRIVVPYAPGGSQDIIARMIAEAVAPFLGQPVVVDNRPGAGAQLGAAAVAHAEPDGYTLLMASPAPVTIAPAVNPRLNYVPARDFIPIVALAEERMVLVIRSDVPARNLGEFLTYLRENPGKVAYSSAGAGSMGHLLGELFRERAGVDILHVPYRGAAPAFTALIAGEVGMAFASPGTARSALDDPKLRFIAVAADTRSALLPDVPTMAEAGLEGVASPLWAGIMAPARTPVDVVTRLRADFARAAATPAMQARYRTLSVEASRLSLPEMERVIDADRQRWQSLVTDAGIRIE